MTEWLNCLQLVAFGKHGNSNSFDSNGNHFGNNSNSSSIITLNNFTDNLMQNEENLLYSSVDAPDVYRVKIIDTDASIRCGLKNHCDNYTVIITSVSISLAEDGKILFVWPFRHIRRYGCTKDGFSLEAGRKCSSGEGLFSFITKDGNTLFQSVASHVNSLKNQRNYHDVVQVNNLNCITNNNVGTGDNPKIKYNNEPSSSSSLSSSSVHSYFNNNETRSLASLNYTPNCNAFTCNSNFLTTNSSSHQILNSKLPEPTKRHSIQSPNSPKIIEKTKLIRVTSVNTSLSPPITSVSISTISQPAQDINQNNQSQKHSPPISKPPRKSKESKINSQLNQEEPVFASREELFGLPPEVNHYETAGNGDDYDDNRIDDDEIVYDEPNELVSHCSSTKVDQSDNKTSGSNPIQIPIATSTITQTTQSVSRFTSVLRMMFTGNLTQQVYPKNTKEKVLYTSNRPNGQSNGPNSLPIVTLTQKVEPQNDLAYARVCLVDVSPKHDHQSDMSCGVKNKPEMNKYAKIINNLNKCSSSSSSSTSSSSYNNHEYVNFPRISHRLDPDGVAIAGKNNDVAKPEHYVQNECEYAKVFKRTTKLSAN